MHYTHVEIGVCDYDRLIDQAPPGSVGLSVEPVKEFFDKLPPRQHWMTANVAIAHAPGIMTIWYVPRAEADKINKGDWVSGCSKIGEPHAAISAMITNGHLPKEALVSCEVEAITIKELWGRYDVTSIDYLKIDTEGYDCKIVKWAVESNVPIRRIMFETNDQSTPQEIDETRQWLKDRGYTILQADGDTVAERIVAPKTHSPIKRRQR